MSKIKSPFTLAATKRHDDPCTIADLDVRIHLQDYKRLFFDIPWSADPEEPHVYKGISFPAGTDNKLVYAAEKLVNFLNQAYHLQKKGVCISHYGKFFLREWLVENTAILATGFGPAEGRHKMTIYGKFQFICFRRSLRALRGKVNYLGRHSDPTLQGLGVALNDFIEIFARTKGASPYTLCALPRHSQNENSPKYKPLVI